MTLTDILEELRAFVRERDWEQYHDPKNLATGLSIEAAELLELFLWTRTSDAHSHGMSVKSRVEEEVADVFLYCLMLADSLDIDILDATHRKLRKNGEKYPVELSKGRSDKYDRLQAETIDGSDAKD